VVRLISLFGHIKESVVKRAQLRRWRIKYTSHFKEAPVIRKLTKEQKREARAYYKELTGKRVQLYSHVHHYSSSGHFTKEYIPYNFYHVEIVPRANVHRLQYAFGDKNLCDTLFPGENVVHSVLKNMNGFFYYEGRPVSKDEAVRLCSNLENKIIKPSRYSGGKGIRSFTSKDGITDLEGKTVELLFKEYNKDFLIQDRVIQHKAMAALNPTSLNTIRILSYRSEMEVLLCNQILRIGKAGALTDNHSAGGVAVAISDEGLLAEEASFATPVPGVKKTESGVVLKDYKIPSYDKVIELIKRLHLMLPFFCLVGWDVAIQEDGEPVLIEFNTDPGLFQDDFPGLGKYSERIIRELWPRPNTWFPL
jgi:hypothetical protein